MAVGGCWPIGPKRPSAPVTQSRIGSSSRGCCPASFTIAACSGWRRFSSRCAKHCRGLRCTIATIRALCCSALGPQSTSYFKTRTWPATWATRWSKGATCWSATISCFSRPWRAVAGRCHLRRVYRRLLRSAGAAIRLAQRCFGPFAGGAPWQFRCGQRDGKWFARSSRAMAYLPALARHLLGEDLKLPSVETWWCGRRDFAQLRAGSLGTTRDQAGLYVAGGATDFCAQSLLLPNAGADRPDQLRPASSSASNGFSGPPLRLTASGTRPGTFRLARS